MDGLRNLSLESRRFTVVRNILFQYIPDFLASQPPDSGHLHEQYFLVLGEINSLLTNNLKHMYLQVVRTGLRIMWIMRNQKKTTTPKLTLQRR